MEQLSSGDSNEGQAASDDSCPTERLFHKNAVENGNCDYVAASGHLPDRNLNEVKGSEGET